MLQAQKPCVNFYFQYTDICAARSDPKLCCKPTTKPMELLGKSQRPQSNPKTSGMTLARRMLKAQDQLDRKKKFKARELAMWELTTTAVCKKVVWKANRTWNKKPNPAYHTTASPCLHSASHVITQGLFEPGWDGNTCPWFQHLGSGSRRFSSRLTLSTHRVSLKPPGLHKTKHNGIHIYNLRAQEPETGR